jgi:ankyrin repeat protein
MASKPPIFAAAQRGDWDVVRQLVDSASEHDLISAVRYRSGEEQDNEGNSLVHYLASSGPLDLLRRLVDANSETLLTRNRIQQTPLVRALMRSDAEGDSIVKFLLARGAAKSVFVAGYTRDSLVVSLPMARKPKSNTVTLPKPVGVSAAHLACIDAALASHIALLDLRYHNTLVPDSATLVIGSKPKPPVSAAVAPQPSAAAAAGAPAFNVFPLGGLALGDIVEV